LYEDLYSVGKSALLRTRIDEKERVLNAENRRTGVKARRGDGTFGELIPMATPIDDPGFKVSHGPVATVEIDVEVKVLAKAMIKQIDRVIGDLVKQVGQFRRGAGNPICVGIVGINSATVTTGYESTRVFATDGKKHKHPHQEAGEAEARLVAEAKPSFDEFLILRYRATNAEPYPFSWTNLKATELDYGAILTRISREYDRRFKD
ncbi:MAG: hypothetical protein ACREXU_18820, partial [Gammaproteobacteria bacterium]